MIRFLLVSILFFSMGLLEAQTVRFPFPHHTSYAGTYIKPSNYTQDELDRQTEAFYDAWKKKYLKVGCKPDQYYVWFEDGNTMTVSEGMGYGMVIVPLMAGYDPDAKKYFDGLNHFYLAHPSHIMHHLMAWKQVKGCKDADGPDSATDGDMDIAFGLLLAYVQWGDTTYLNEAKRMIADIEGENRKEGDINQDLSSVKLGDWVTDPGVYMNSTRTSDFIMDHFRVFSEASGDTLLWNNVIDTCYALINKIQTQYSPQTGLLPDFIIHLAKNPEPAYPNFLESKLDGNYSYNACRDPWRITNDYLLNGDIRARKAVLKISRWLYESTGGSVNKITAGYYLTGKKAVYWSDMAFTAPFTVGAMLDTANQEWLNKLYARVLLSKVSSGGYYDNTLKLLSLITLSGNYWAPPKEVINAVNPVRKPKNIFRIYPTMTSRKVNVKVLSKNTGKNTQIAVFCLTGKKLFQESLTTVLSQGIDFSDYRKGIYLVTLLAPNGKPLAVQKIIKY
jgi:endo-1,4-beta-D-glucanase Y